jgi:hypothetical protein
MAERSVPWRTLTCIRCKNPVPVLEIPRVFVDPKGFVCGGCLRPKPVPVPYNTFPAGY